jgi:hypothetical protein
MHPMRERKRERMHKGKLCQEFFVSHSVLHDHLWHRAAGRKKRRKKKKKKKKKRKKSSSNFTADY